jgi:hypothetical protein
MSPTKAKFKESPEEKIFKGSGAEDGDVSSEAAMEACMKHASHKAAQKIKGVLSENMAVLYLKEI